MTAAHSRDPRRWFYRAAHQGYTTVGVLLVAFLLVTTSVADNLVIMKSTLVLVVVFSVLSWLEFGVHQRLCPLCAAQLPLNPSADVTAKDRQLRWYHFMTTAAGSSRWFSPGVYISAAMLLVVEATFLLPAPGYIRNIVCAVGVVGWGLCQTTTGRTHGRLRPWCPYCRHGGRPTFAPQPVPTGQVN